MTLRSPPSIDADVQADREPDSKLSAKMRSADIVEVGVRDCVCVAVGVRLCVEVGVRVAVNVAVGVREFVGVAVRVAVEVRLGVRVGV